MSGLSDDSRRGSFRVPNDETADSSQRRGHILATLQGHEANWVTNACDSNGRQDDDVGLVTLGCSCSE
jgi:hypothetical protein